MANFRRQDLDLIVVQIEESQIVHFFDDLRRDDGDLILKRVEHTQMAQRGQYLSSQNER